MAYTAIRDGVTGEIVGNGVRRDADNAFIPADPRNRDWQAVLAWLETNELAEPPLLPEPVPESASNSDWRVALILWGRFEDVASKVIAARDSGSFQGQVVWQRWEYANDVYWAELMQLRQDFGFSEAEVDESLRRADRVSKGDLTGVWPLAA